MARNRFRHRRSQAGRSVVGRRETASRDDRQRRFSRPHPRCLMSAGRRTGQRFPVFDPLVGRDTNRLRHGAAPSLPRPYVDAIDGAVIGPAAGSCGTAAYRAEPVIVRDIATDPCGPTTAIWPCRIGCEHVGRRRSYPRKEEYWERSRLLSRTTQPHSARPWCRRADDSSCEYRHRARASGGEFAAERGPFARCPEPGPDGQLGIQCLLRAFFASRELLRIFGLDPDEEKPTREMFQEKIHPDDLSSLQEVAASGKREDQLRIRFSNPFSRRLDQAWPQRGPPRVRPFRRPRRVCCTTLDVTERKRADEERERAEERLRQAQAISLASAA